MKYSGTPATAALEKLEAAQLFKKYPIFHGTLRVLSHIHKKPPQADESSLPFPTFNLKYSERNNRNNIVKTICSELLHKYPPGFITVILK
jgi:hypothetical protein